MFKMEHDRETESESISTPHSGDQPRSRRDCPTDRPTSTSSSSSRSRWSGRATVSATNQRSREVESAVGRFNALRWTVNVARSSSWTSDLWVRGNVVVHYDRIFELPSRSTASGPRTPMMGTASPAGTGRPSSRSRGGLTNSAAPPRPLEVELLPQQACRRSRGPYSTMMSQASRWTVRRGRISQHRGALGRSRIIPANSPAEASRASSRPRIVRSPSSSNASWRRSDGLRAAGTGSSGTRPSGRGPRS